MVFVGCASRTVASMVVRKVYFYRVTIRQGKLEIAENILNEPTTISYH
jgi:hypothetical protein